MQSKRLYKIKKFDGNSAIYHNIEENVTTRFDTAEYLLRKQKRLKQLQTLLDDINDGKLKLIFKKEANIS